MYQKSFHTFQKKYISQNKNSLRMREILCSYKDYFPKNSILDVGCGSGIDFSFFKELGFKKISGVDITQGLVSIAQKENPYAEIVHGTFLDLEWQDNSFDVIWSKYALQVNKNIHKSLSEIARVVRNNGYVFLQITHPFRSLGFTDSKNYFFEEKITYSSSENKKQIFTEYHINLTQWIQEILKNNLYIVHFEEILNKSLEKYQGIVTPSALILVLKKYEKKN